VALDTASERRAIIFPSSPWRSAMPVPDSSISVADRIQLAYYYGGVVSLPVAGWVCVLSAASRAPIATATSRSPQATATSRAPQATAEAYCR